MSPTILSEDGYKIVIYFNDHLPSHVHVKKAGKEARVGLSPVTILSNWGYNRREIRAILDIVEKHQDFLLQVWDGIYGED